MADKQIKIPPGFQVPDGYFEPLEEKDFGFRQSPPGMTTPENYFEKLEDKLSPSPAKHDGKKPKQLWPVMIAILSTAAVLVCFFWLDGVLSSRHSWNEVSTEEITQQLVYSESDLYYLIDDQLEVEISNNIPSGLEAIPEDELEETLNIEIKQLETWYD